MKLHAAAFQTPVAHPFPQGVVHPPGRHPPHGGREMARLLAETFPGLRFQPLPLRDLILGDRIEQARRVR